MAHGVGASIHQRQGRARVMGVWRVGGEIGEGTFRSAAACAHCDQPRWGRAMANCEVQAVSAYPNDTTSLKADHFVVLCMKAAGFDWDLGDSRCKHFPLERDAYCYVPDNPVGRWLYRTVLRRN